MHLDSRKACMKAVYLSSRDQRVHARFILTPVDSRGTRPNLDLLTVHPSCATTNNSLLSTLSLSSNNVSSNPLCQCILIPHHGAPSISAHSTPADHGTGVVGLRPF